MYVQCRFIKEKKTSIKQIPVPMKRKKGVRKYSTRLSAKLQEQ